VRLARVDGLGAVDGGAALVGGGTSSIFAPVSTPAESIVGLAMLVLAVAAGIFLTVGGLLVYCVARYRSRPQDAGREPPQVYGSGSIELAWTVVPLLIVLILFLATARTIGALGNPDLPPGTLHVTVIGHQWWWEIRYPELGVVTANELHVPVSDGPERRPTLLTLESADVVHSFWVPQLAGKTDVVPNRVNQMWVEPRVPGTYLGQCAEFCGTQHAGMLLRVIVHPKGELERWAAEQRGEPVAQASVASGRERFLATACVNCHRVGGTPAGGSFGPDLTHLMSRSTIAAGVAENTPANLRLWLVNPALLKPGARMPAMKLSDGEVDEMVAYLLTLR
jgi:cytochrome c oxidase subunit 2